MSDTGGRESAPRYVQEQKVPHSVADEAPVLIWISNPDKRRTYFNHCWAVFTGYPLEELLNDGWTRAVHPDDIEGYLTTYSRAFDARQDFRMEYRLRRYDGAYSWFLDTGTPRHRESGEFAGYVGSSVDITERKQAEEIIWESRRLLRLCVENVPAAVAVFDRDMRYLMTSRRWLADYGLGGRDIIGKSHYEIFPEIPDRWKETYRKCLEGRSEKCDEDSFQRGDGSTEWVRWEVHPWHLATGQIGGIIIFTEVITAQKRQQRERSNILSMFAHDMKNPVVISGGILSRLLAGKTGALSEIQKGYLESVQEELKKVDDLLMSFLDFSNFDARKYAPSIEPFQICSAIKRCVTHAALEAQKKDVSIVFDCPGDESLVVRADPLMINRVITNLLDNAVKYTHRGGPVVVTLRDRVDGMLVQVADRGVGIAEEHLPFIFDAFYRVRNDRQGSGLGLAIAKTIVEAHGGKIWVESVHGQGSTFSVVLPKQHDASTGERE